MARIARPADQIEKVGGKGLTRGQGQNKPLGCQLSCHCGTDHIVQPAQRVEHHIKAPIQPHHTQHGDIRLGEQRRMHRIKALLRVEHDIGLLGRVDHIGGIAIAVGKVQPPLRDEPIVPACRGRIKRRLRPQRQDARAGGGHTISGGRITARLRAKEQDVLEILKEAVVDEPVNIAIDRGITKPAVPAADDRQMGPAFALGKGKAARGGVVQFLYLFGMLEGDQ